MESVGRDGSEHRKLDGSWTGGRPFHGPLSATPPRRTVPGSAARDGLGRVLRCLACLALLPGLGAAIDAVDPDGSADINCLPPAYAIVEFDDQIVFANARAGDEGWVEARTADGARLDTARLLLQTRLPVSVSYRIGSELVSAAGGRVPLQTASRCLGRGRWDNGQFFGHGHGWSQWSVWTDGNSVWRRAHFAANQLCGIEFKARAQRQGYRDLAGVYRQTLYVTITAANGGTFDE